MTIKRFMDSRVSRSAFYLDRFESIEHYNPEDRERRQTMIKRVNIIDVGGAKTVVDRLQQGEPCKINVDDVNYRDSEPIGAGYVAAWLIRCGFEANVVWPLSDAISVEECLAGNPQAVCFSSMTFNYPTTRKLAERVRRSKPEMVIIIGGYHAACMPQEVNAETVNGRPLFDFVVTCEGELNVGGILKYLNGQAVREEIEGVVYHHGEPWVDKLRRFDLRLNPAPLRLNAVMSRGRRYGLYYPAPSKQRGVTLFTWSRGCPYNCAFCDSKTMFPTCKGQPAVIYRDIGDIIDEIRFCQQEYGTNFGFSVDLNTPGTTGDDGHGLAWLRELCREIKKTDLRFYTMCRLDVNPECFEILAGGGCTQIGFGVESLTNSRKSGTQLSIAGWRQLAKDVVFQLRDLQMMSKLYYILGGMTDEGNPFTVDDIRAEGDAILDVGCDMIRLAWMVPPLNRPIFSKLQAAGLLEGEGRDYSLMSTDVPIIKVAGKTALELQAMRSEIIREFFSPKRYGPHARMQVSRVPDWEESFREFDELLRRQLGQGWSR